MGFERTLTLSKLSAQRIAEAAKIFGQEMILRSHTGISASSFALHKAGAPVSRESYQVEGAPGPRLWGPGWRLTTTGITIGVSSQSMRGAASAISGGSGLGDLSDYDQVPPVLAFGTGMEASPPPESQLEYPRRA